jgi:hypothetical protein
LPSLRRWRELRAWARTGTSLEDLRERYPASGASAEALEMARLTEPLGLRLLAGLGEEWRTAHGDLHDATGEYIAALTQAPAGDPAGQVPEKTRELLLAHHAAIAAAVDHLASATDISWELDIDANLLQWQPSAPALYALHRLLLVTAVARHERRDCPSVRRALEAARRVPESLDKRPDMTSQLLAMGLARQANAVLRVVGARCNLGASLLPQSRYRSALPGALQTDGFFFLIWAADPGRTSLAANGRASAPRDWVERAGAAGASAYLRRGWRRVQAEDPCDLGVSQLEHRLTGDIPRWEFVAKIALEGLGRRWAAALGTDLDAEATRLVLLAHGRQRARGDWGGMGAVPSEVCHQVVWRHESDSSGRLTIAPEPVPPSQEGREWAFKLSAPARSSPGIRRSLQ